MLTTDIEKAKAYFCELGFDIPAIPEKFAIRLKERAPPLGLDESARLFSTRKIEKIPYWLDHYVKEADEKLVEDYLVLSHSGHGINSYAVQYYIVDGAFRMFVHLGWGGAYHDMAKDEARIHECFPLADQIITAAQSFVKTLNAGELLTVVATDWGWPWGSYWLRPGETKSRQPSRVAPAVVLAEVLHWLTNVAIPKG